MNATLNTMSYIMPRLVVLSMICGICWLLRACYLIMIECNSHLFYDKLMPSSMDDQSWESLYWCVTEWLPCMAALYFMLTQAKPKDKSRYFSATGEEPSKHKSKKGITVKSEDFLTATENVEFSHSSNSG